MKNHTASIIAIAGLVAAALGLSSIPASASDPRLSTLSAMYAPAPIGIDHHAWLDTITPHPIVPSVDNAVRQSR